MNATSRPSVIFDLGKVLVDFDFSIAARHLSQHSELASEPFRLMLDQSPLLHRLESGAIDNQQFYAEVCEQARYRADYATFAEAFADIFTEIPAMTEWHQSLRDAGLKTYIFSNTNDLAVQHIRRRFPFFSRFDGYIFSHVIRAMKPLPASYEAIEQLTGKQGDALLYLDDRAENIEGAQKRGWQTLLHVTPAQSIAAANRILGL